MKYPVSGYRTNAARAMGAGFQSVPLPRSAGTPAIGGKPSASVTNLNAYKRAKGLLPPLPATRGQSLTPLIARPFDTPQLTPGQVRALAAAMRLGAAGARSTPLGRALKIGDLALQAFGMLPEVLVGRAEAHAEANGWTLCKTCIAGPPEWQDSVSGVLTSCTGAMMSCWTNQSRANIVPVGTPVPSSNREVWWWKVRTLSPLRYDSMYTWWKASPKPTTAPQWVPLRPLILIPAIEPWSPPVRRLGPRWRPNTLFRVAGNTDPLSPPASRPLIPRRPPGKRTKEKKFTLMSGGPLRKLVELAFEGTELVNILHDALPNDCKTQGFTTVAMKAADVFRCAPQLDVCKAMQGLINNAIEDKIIGLIGQAGKRQAQSIGKAYGISGLSKKLGGDSSWIIPKFDLGCGQFTMGN